jgi:hypothetical protein
MYVAVRSNRSRDPTLPSPPPARDAPQRFTASSRRDRTQDTVVPRQQLPKKSVRYRQPCGHTRRNIWQEASLFAARRAGRPFSRRAFINMHGHASCSVVHVRNGIFTTGNRRGSWWESDHMDQQSMRYIRRICFGRFKDAAIRGRLLRFGSIGDSSYRRGRPATNQNYFRAGRVK